MYPLGSCAVWTSHLDYEWKQSSQSVLSLWIREMQVLITAPFSIGDSAAMGFYLSSKNGPLFAICTEDFPQPSNGWRADVCGKSSFFPPWLLMLLHCKESVCSPVVLEFSHLSLIKQKKWVRTANLAPRSLFSNLANSLIAHENKIPPAGFKSHSLSSWKNSPMKLMSQVIHPLPFFPFLSGKQG